jgi:PAS domain S-box-containing protein
MSKTAENKVLYIEGSPADSLLLERESLESAYPFIIRLASSLREAREILSMDAFHAVVSDLYLVDGVATDLIPLPGSLPLIVITGEGSEDTAIKALKAGANDYLIKDIGLQYLKFLPLTVIKSIEQKKQRDELEEYRTRLESLVLERTTELTEMYQQLQESIDNFRNIFNNTSDGFIITDYDFNFLEANNTLLDRFGITKEYLTTVPLISFLSPDYHQLIYNHLELLRDGLPSGDIEIEIIAPLTGKVIPYEINNVPIMFNRQKAILTVMRDITDRKSIARRLFETIIETEEVERLRIARDLHDEIGPLMSALKIFTTSYTESSNPERKNKLAGQISVIIRDMIDSIKEISNDMSPHVLVNFGLQAALQNIINLFSRNLAIHNQSNLEQLRFSNTVESVVYRIIKELIHNTVKHARANNIYIQLEYAEPLLLCHYRDDGIGFEFQQISQLQSKGMGISNMVSRIKSLGGDLEINTSPGKGFSLDLKIRTTPLNSYEKP